MYHKLAFLCDLCFYDVWLFSGEYIALYQIQRTLLRQRAKEKDEQLSKLSKDREEMRNKLSELTKLVQQLVTEKEALYKISHGVPVEQSVENTSVNYRPQEEEGIVKIILELNYCWTTYLSMCLKTECLLWYAYFFPFVICCFSWFLALNSILWRPWNSKL